MSLKKKKLFDELERKYKGPAFYAESKFNYLNRSARLECKKVRALLEEWFSHFPDEHKDDLRKRFRSRDDRQHYSAFFELYIHELLLKLGFLVEIHPSINNKKTTHPDFKVLKNRKPIFYLETTLDTLSDEEKSAKSRLDKFYDVLNKVHSPNFFIGAYIYGLPATNVPAGKIKESLEEWLSELDPNEITKQYEKEGLEGIPRWVYEFKGGKIAFFPIPKKPESRGKAGRRTIGMQLYDVRWVDSHIKIRKTIIKKASKYGKLALPYIIAINIIDEFPIDNIDIDICNALFGEEQYFASQTGGFPPKLKFRRKPDGAWFGPKGPRNKRVSAVIVVTNLVPWNITKVTPCIWYNPWANFPLAPDILPFPQMIPDLKTSKLLKHKGKNGWEILELNPNWPFNELKSYYDEARKVKSITSN